MKVTKNMKHYFFINFVIFMVCYFEITRARSGPALLLFLEGVEAGEDLSQDDVEQSHCHHEQQNGQIA